MDTQAKPSPLKIWATAVRPFAYTASLLAVALGLALAYYAGFPIRWGLLALTLAGVLCFHTGANLLNDCFDHRRGLDTEILPTSGAIVRGWLSERQVLRAAIVCLLCGAVCGLALTALRGWTVLALGAAGSLIALGYTRGGVCFKYCGLGDAAIFLAFGVLPVFGTFWVQADLARWTPACWLPVWWSVPLASYTTAIVHANNWHDIARDRATGCRTPAGVLGPLRSGHYYRILILGPYVLVLAGLLYAGPLTTAAVILSLPLAARLARADTPRRPEVFAMLDARTAQLHTAFGALLVTAFFIGRACGI